MNKSHERLLRDNNQIQSGGNKSLVTSNCPIDLHVHLLVHFNDI